MQPSLILTHLTSTSLSQLYTHGILDLQSRTCFGQPTLAKFAASLEFGTPLGYKHHRASSKALGAFAEFRLKKFLVSELRPWLILAQIKTK